MLLSAFFQRRENRIAKFPEGRVGFAVGDIHGRSDLLRHALDRLARERDKLGADKEPLLVFLGDYVDRGPDSPGVIDLLIERAGEGFETHFLKGNHEAAMLAFMEDPLLHRGWLTHGGLETMVSYGVRPLPSIAAADGAIIAAAEKLKELVPSSHLEFLNGLEKYVVAGDYLFVHAGVDCGRPLDSQTEEDLFWARKKFISDKRRYSHFIVHGHTPVDAPYGDERRICIDTGAYATGRLSIAKFEDELASALIIDIDGDHSAAAYWASLK